MITPAAFRFCLSSLISISYSFACIVFIFSSFSLVLPLTKAKEEKYTKIEYFVELLNRWVSFLKWYIIENIVNLNEITCYNTEYRGRAIDAPIICRQIKCGKMEETKQRFPSLVWLKMIWKKCSEQIFKCLKVEKYLYLL